MATTDYGADISCLPDLDPMGTIRTGQAVLSEAIARRLITQRGTLIDNPNYGTDVRGWLNESITNQALAEVKAAIERECRQDERVLSADAQVGFDQPSMTIQVGLTLTTANGPFKLVLAITAVTIQIMQGG